jgi:hypothetical protein
VSEYRLALTLGCVLALTADLAGQLRPDVKDPFSFFNPVVTIAPADREQIDNGEVLIRILPAPDGEVAVFAASRIDEDGDALVRWTHAIEQLKKGPYVMTIRRFSDPPVLADLDSLVLDDVDLEGIRECRAGDCSIKLAAHEIEALKAAITNADWKSAVQRQFKRVLFERVSKYLTGGFSALPPYADRPEPTAPREQLAGILNRSPHLRSHFPTIVNGLGRYPRVELPHTQSFLYWSKEHYGRGKPVIAITQVHIVQPVGPSLPSVAVFGQEIFASHYRDGSLGTTFVLDGGSHRYLVYLNRSRLDPLDGRFGGLKRKLVQRKLGSELKTAIEGVRRRIESGDPAESMISSKMP